MPVFKCLLVFERRKKERNTDLDADTVWTGTLYFCARQRKTKKIMCLDVNALGGDRIIVLREIYFVAEGKSFMHACTNNSSQF